MIPTQDEIDIQGNIDGEEVALGLDEGSLSYIMSLLTNLYSDKILAVIRELSTNALDAHKAASVDKPIEVTLPSRLDPFFHIQDFGVGLSPDDLNSIYRFYGSSTKRESDEFNGVMGIGSKSPLTYTDQFTIVSNKDGIRTMVMVSRSANGGGSMTIVGEPAPTTEDNGTTITVPVNPRDTNDFLYKSQYLFKFWQPGTVLVNGAAPTPIWEKAGARWLNDEILLVPERMDNDFIVMGNVPYPVAKFSDHWRPNYSVICFAPMGSVQFAPNREALRDTGRTTQTVNAYKDTFNSLFEAEGQAEVDAAETPFAGIDIANNWYHRYGLDLKVAGGYKVRSIMPEGYDGMLGYDIWDNQAYKTTVLPSAFSGAKLIITGFDKKRLSTVARHRIKELHGDEGGPIFLIKDSLPFFEGAPKVITWEELMQVEVDAPKVKKEAAPWPVVGKGDVTNLTGKIVYGSPKDFDASDLYSFADDVTIVLVPVNRWERLMREYPKAELLNTWLNGIVKDKYDALTDEDRASGTRSDVGNWSTYGSGSVSHSRILDPKIAQMVRMQNKPTADLQEFLRLYNKFSRQIQFRYVENNDRYVAQNYPLIAGRYGFSYDQLEDLYLYLNTKYEEMQKSESTV